MQGGFPITLYKNLTFRWEKNVKSMKRMNILVC